MHTNMKELYEKFWTKDQVCFKIIFKGLHPFICFTSTIPQEHIIHKFFYNLCSFLHAKCNYSSEKFLTQDQDCLKVCFKIKVN